MANVKGIIVEIGGNTSKLQDALEQVNKKTSSLSKELKEVSSLLKLDPKNTNMLSQKQELLNEKLKTTKERLNSLTDVQDQVQKKWENYLKVEPKLNKITESLEKSKEELKKLKEKQKEATEAFEAGKISEEQYKKIKDTVKQCSDKVKELKEKQDELSKNTVSTESYRNYQREIEKTKQEVIKLQNETSKLGQASDSMLDFSKNLDKIASKVDNLGNKLSTRVTAPLVGIVGYGLKYNADMEKYTTAFETFIGDAKEAEKVVNKIKSDASKTPFDVTSLVKANQMLISTGENAGNAQEVILALGDAVTATGGGNDELTRMSANLQQIKNAGKATALDIKQFAYAGIDIYGLLADYTGKTTDSVK